MFAFTFITLILFTGYAILISYYYFAWEGAKTFQLTDTLPSDRSVIISVIIPVRNEEHTIRACIESLFLQTYPFGLFEIIIIDDFSTDSTRDVVRALHYDGLSLSCICLSDLPKEEAGRGYKKTAIGKGIDAATGQLIVTTDADCTFDKDWLATIAAYYHVTGAKFIASPVKIASGSSFLAVFQILDFITLQGITGASVSKKIHSMCNGANLAYEKKVFFEVDGFQDIEQIPSGDDMLLMHKIYRKYPANVHFLKSKSAVVTTKPEKTWTAFIHQRVRWASKTSHYDDKRIFWTLLLVYLVNLCLLGLAVAGIWNAFYLFVLLVLLIAKTCIEYPFVYSAATFFGQQKLMRYFAFLQPFHVLYTVFIGFLGKMGKYQWKGRAVK